MLEEKRRKLCTFCRSIEDLDCYSGEPIWTGRMHISRASFTEGCVSCASFSQYLEDCSRDETTLNFVGHRQMKPGMEPQRGVIESSFHDSDSSNLMYIDIWNFLEDTSLGYTLVPEERHSLNLEKGREHYAIIDVASANLVRAKKWVETCKTHHAKVSEEFEKACVAPPVKTKSPVRIIDCRTLCVRALLPDESYICLSYVWGSSRPAKAPIDSRLDAATIPKTISDAMFVAEQLGIPRIWVDQYCIDQDEIGAKHDAIASMHLIYGSAEVTIVAASTTDASQGLPGILGTKRTHPTHSFVTLGSRKFVKYPHICTQVKNTRWNTRGWTFQEALLSLRLLVFTESQMYFQCARMHCPEYFMAERVNVDGDNHEQRVFPTRGIGTYADHVFERICEYFSRELSFPMDNLKAIEGVLEAFSEPQMGTRRARHFYGTAVLYYINDTDGERFDAAQGLCWWVENDKPDAEHKENVGSLNPGLPSWTWASRKSARSSSKRLSWGYPATRIFNGRNVKYHITDRNGERVDLFQYAISGSRHYSEFHPWIDITTLTIQGHITKWNSEGTAGYTFSGLENTHFYLDDGIPQDNEEVTAIFLCGRQDDDERLTSPIHFLLIQPATPGTFYRVGTFLLHCNGKGTLREFVENPERSLRSCGLRNDATMERKTVRVV